MERPVKSQVRYWHAAATFHGCSMVIFNAIWGRLNCRCLFLRGATDWGAANDFGLLPRWTVRAGCNFSPTWVPVSALFSHVEAMLVVDWQTIHLIVPGAACVQWHLGREIATPPCVNGSEMWLYSWSLCIWGSVMFGLTRCAPFHHRSNTRIHEWARHFHTFLVEPLGKLFRRHGWHHYCPQGDL